MIRIMMSKKMIKTGLLLLVLFLFLLYYFQVRKEFKKCTQAVTATYVGVGPGLGKSFGHTLLFTYDYNGKHYESKESMTSQNIFSFRREKMNQKMKQLGYEIGQNYTILVNPNQPEKFISDTKSTYRSLTLGCVLLLFLVLMACLKK